MHWFTFCGLTQHKLLLLVQLDTAWDLVFYIVQLQENNKCFRTQIDGPLVLKNLTPCLSALVRSHKSAHKSETTNISVMNTVSLNTTSWLSAVPMDAARNTPEIHRWILPTCIHARASPIHYSYFHYSSILYLHYVKPNIFYATLH